MTLAVQTIASQSEDLTAARRAMIDSQLRVSGINQPWLLEAIARVAREDYVPVAARGHAYIDRAIPIDADHALPAPLVQAKLLAEAAPRADDKVLVISQSGYLGALVEPMVQSVETVDAAGALALQSMPVYKLLLIDGAIEQLPANVVAALVDGARVVTGLVERGVTRLASGTVKGGGVSLEAVADLGIPVLREFAAPKTWSF
ncbi:MAG TPA: protein-L-isoaspartate O-methyltransferase [Novosphingobium sp.]|nr:protein-L-isoaspartate O-methyltransferase [Novosphingobium sp.]HQA17599.1 protein-L-isoaspartate O-methyltransferase [Novosphingobium sp.]